MSADREINFKFTAETKAAERKALQLADSLNTMQDNATKATNKLKAMSQDLMRANDALTATSTNMGGSEEALDAFGERMDTARKRIQLLIDAYEYLKNAAQPHAEILNKAISDEDSIVEAKSILNRYKQTQEAANKLAVTVRTLREEMDAANQSMQGGLTSQAEQSIAELNEQIEKITDALNKIGKASSITINGVTHTANELSRALTKADDAKNAIMRGNDEVDSWMKRYADGTTDATDKIVKNYKRLQDSEAKAAARAEATAERKIERIDEQTAREAASIEELTEKEKELAEAREKAKAEGNVVEEAKYAEALKKTTAEIERKTRAQERAAAAVEREASAQQKAQEKAAEAARKAGDTATQSIASLIRAAATGTLTVRGLATSIRGLGAAIKAGLGPIGWAVLAIEGLIFAAQTAWGWLKKLWEDNTRAAEESAKRQQQILDEAIKAAEKAREKYEGFLAEQQEKEALDAISESIKNITENLKDKNEELDKALTLALQEAALTSEQEDLERKLALAQLARAKILGQITEDEYRAEKQIIEREALQKKQARETNELLAKQNAQVAKRDATNASIDTAQNKRDRLEGLLQMLRDDDDRNQDSIDLRGYRAKLAEFKKSQGFENYSDAEIQNILNGYIRHSLALAEDASNRGNYQKADNFTKLAEEKKALIEIIEEIARIEETTESEIEILKGYDPELAEAFRKQIEQGKETDVYEAIGKRLEDAAATVKTLLEDKEKQEAKIDELAAKINALPQNQGIAMQTLETRQLNENDKAAKDKREKEAKASLKAARDAAEIQKLIAGYQGKGKKKLGVFMNADISGEDEEAIKALVESSKGNESLMKVLESLLGRVEKSEGITDETRAFIYAQQARLAEIEGIAAQEAAAKSQRTHDANVQLLGEKNFKGLSKNQLKTVHDAAGIFSDGRIAKKEQDQFNDILEIAQTNQELYGFIERLINHMATKNASDAQLHQQALDMKTRLQALEKQFIHAVKKAK